MPAQLIQLADRARMGLSEAERRELRALRAFRNVLKAERAALDAAPEQVPARQMICGFVSAVRSALDELDEMGFVP